MTEPDWIRWPNRGLRVSSVGYGLSRLHRIASSRARAGLMDTAYAQGVRYFDAARQYGDGLSEREIGALIRRGAKDVVVATKFGRPASALVEAVPLLRFPRIAVRRALVQARLFTDPPARITVAELRDSVARSLRALGGARIDVLFAHEPEAGALTRPDELRREIERLKAAGDVGLAGYSGAAAGAVAWSQAAPWFSEVLQVEDSADGSALQALAAAGLKPDVTFGHFRGLRASGRMDAAEAAALARARNPAGTVLFASSDPANVKAMALALRRRPRA